MFVPSFIALSMSSGLATPSWRRLNASFIIGTRRRFTTNPGDSLTSTASLPSLVQRSLTSRMVPSDVSADLGQDPVDFGLGHLAFLDALLQRLLDSAEAAVDEALLDVPHRDLKTGRGARLGDPRPHRPGADHSNPLDVVRAHRDPVRAECADGP